MNESENRINVQIWCDLTNQFELVTIEGETIADPRNNETDDAMNFKPYF